MDFPILAQEIFEIISAHICNDDPPKRYVVYTLQVCHVTKKFSTPTVAFERRYTQFLELYNGLTQEHPDLMSSVLFPKKALIGNFDNTLIETRRHAFESLLKYIMSEERLRSSKALLNFLQEHEMIIAKRLIFQGDHDLAGPILKNTFELLNHIYTGRSPQVLLALCRVLCCSYEAKNTDTLKWAELALHRFDGVSDSDLLLLYVPLLRLCKNVWMRNGRDKKCIDQRLKQLKQQGFICADNVSFMTVILQVELKLTGTPT